MRILIVDDTETSRHNVKNILQEYGQCDTAENGDDALSAVKNARSEMHPYDLLTLDFQMPQMGGPLTLLAIRATEDKLGIKETDRVKVLIITSQSDTNNIMESITTGCQDYVVKPINSDVLIEKVKSIGFTFEEEKSNIEVDDDMVRLFINILGERISILKKSIEKDDYKYVEQLGHQIHGTGSTYGFAQVSNIGEELEDAARKGDHNRIRRKIVALETIYNENKKLGMSG